MEQQRLNNMESRLQRVEETVKQIELQTDKIEDKTNKIYTVLVGDEFNMDKGLVAEVKALRERVYKLEVLKNKVIWISIGAGVAGGLSLDKIIEWIQEAASK